jgi:hypothetical protein
MRGQDQRGGELLRKALAIEPNNADVRHSLGLLLVRQRNYAEALAVAASRRSSSGQCALRLCLYRSELHRCGRPGDGVGTHSPAASGGSRRSCCADFDCAGPSDLATALLHARELLVLAPADPQLRALVQDLEKRQGR